MSEALRTLLQARVNSHGLVLLREAVARATLKATKEELTRELAALEKLCEIELLEPGEFLVIRLLEWSGRREKPAKSSQSAYSYSKLFNPDSENSYRQAEQAALLAEILKTLGESDPENFRPAVEKYSPQVIRKALDRVRRTPGIRKNPTALFRFLLVKLAPNPHASK